MMRKEFVGAAPLTTLSSGINASATSFTVQDGSGYPTGVNPFVIVIDRGESNEEKILCSSRSGNTFTVQQRGYDGTTASSHGSGSTVLHGLDSITIDEANAHVHDMEAHEGVTDHGELNGRDASSQHPIGSITDLQGELDSKADTHAHPYAPDSHRVPSGGIIMWSGSVASIPSGWALCNGNNGTPNLTDRFLVGAGNQYDVGDTGGSDSVAITESQMPSHDHTQDSHDHLTDMHGHSASGLSLANQTSSHSHSVSGGSHQHDGRHRSFDIGSGSVAQWNPRRPGDTGGTTQTGPLTFDDAAHSHSVGNQSSSHSHNISGSTGEAAVGTDSKQPSISSTGGGDSHENRPPYYALAYIMKL